MEAFFSHMSIPMAVLGVGLVIFVHEAGHFIAARLCGVRVEVFSLGFGPRLLGWRRGGTLYQIALVPLGGYVKMAGDEMDTRGRQPRPDDLRAKSVGARFFIYSGGVLMNVIFALVVFPLVLLAGVPSMVPVVDAPLPGSPAWYARVPAGSRILAVNDKQVFDFFHIGNEIALGGSEPVRLELLAPGDSAPRVFEIVPRYSEDPGFYRVGLSPAPDPTGKILVAQDSPATLAGLDEGDRILGVEGASPALSLRQQLILAFKSMGPVTLRVAGDPERLVTVTPEEGEAFTTRRAFGIERRKDRPRLIGVEPVSAYVKDLRGNAIARSLGIHLGDRVRSVNGRPIHRSGDFLLGLLAGEGRLVIDIERNGERHTLEGPTLTDPEAVALASDVNVSIDLESTLVAVMPSSAAAAAGMESGDRILAIGGEPVATWTQFQEHARAAASKEDEAVTVSIEREAADGAVEVLSIAVTPAVIRPMLYGFSLQTAEYVYKAANASEALIVGVSSSWRFMTEAVRSLRRMLTQEVSAQNLGGIITIGVVTESWASKGFAKLFFFLCILSMNLAFLNVLPIPILDGGHLFFLLVEKLKGSPVSERTLGYSQVVGLVLIMTLMVYVTYNDVARWFID